MGKDDMGLADTVVVAAGEIIQKHPVLSVTIQRCRVNAKALGDRVGIAIREGHLAGLWAKGEQRVDRRDSVRSPGRALASSRRGPSGNRACRLTEIEAGLIDLDLEALGASGDVHLTDLDIVKLGAAGSKDEDPCISHGL